MNGSSDSLSSESLRNLQFSGCLINVAADGDGAALKVRREHWSSDIAAMEDQIGFGCG